MQYNGIPNDDYQSRISYNEANEVLYDAEAVGSTDFAYRTKFSLLHDSGHIDALNTFIESAAGQGQGESAALRAETASISEVETILHVDDMGGLYDVISDGQTSSCETLLEYRSNLSTYQTISDLFSTEPSEALRYDGRYLHMETVLAEFLTQNQMYNAGSFAADTPGSFEATQKFAKHYYDSLDATMAIEQWEPFIHSCREDFVKALATPKMRHLVPKLSRDRASKVAQETPILIMDPLASLRAKPNEFSEIYGSFAAKQRIIKLDPFSITTEVPADYTNAETLNYKQTIMKMVVFHELIHAFTTEDYFLEESTYLQARELWPHYWAEGMTEKLANVGFGEISDTSEFNRIAGVTGDARAQLVRQISRLAIAPAEMLHTPAVEANRKVVASSYPEQRLLIDTIFSKLDWAAAGLTSQQAERLAAAAFTEIPANDSSLKVRHTTARNSKRLEFISAVNLAAHPGFMMKLNGLVEMYDTHLVLEMLLDRKFKPHDPESVPWIMPPALLSELHMQAGLYEDLGSTDRLAMPKELTDDELQQRRLQTISSAEAAVAGLRDVIQTRLDPLRDPASPQSQMLDKIFGRNDVGLPNVRLYELADHRQAISDWVDSQKQS